MLGMLPWLAHCPLGAGVLSMCSISPASIGACKVHRTALVSSFRLQAASPS